MVHYRSRVFALRDGPRHSNRIYRARATRIHISSGSVSGFHVTADGPEVYFLDFARRCLYPRLPKKRGLGCSAFARHTCGITFVFFSYGLLRFSVPTFASLRNDSLQLAGLRHVGNPGIQGRFEPPGLSQPSRLIAPRSRLHVCPLLLSLCLALSNAIRRGSAGLIFLVVLFFVTLFFEVVQYRQQIFHVHSGTIV